MGPAGPLRYVRKLWFAGRVATGEEKREAGQELPPDNQGARRSAWLALEYPAMGDFDDPKLEWRRLFSEILGTFLLVLVAAGAGLLHVSNGDQVSLAAAVVAPGLMVMAIILFMGAVSGAHLNPGVSIAFALRRDFPWRRVPGYIIAQLVGAVLAAVFLYAVFGDAGNLGTTTPGPGFAAWGHMAAKPARPPSAPS